MEKFSKKEIFNAPEGYFDDLSDNILERYENEKVRPINLFKKYAAAAVLLLGVGLYFIYQTSQTLDTGNNILSFDIDMYIDADYWQAEDILMLADNPNSILDEIISYEWGYYETEEDGFDFDIW